MRIRESEIPVPTHNDTLVRILACGICGTDLHFLRNNEAYTPLGHEISAIVVAVGESVTKISVGDMVVVEDCTSCGSCIHCKNGESHLCRNMTTLNGQSGMGEYLLVHENNLVSCRTLTKEQATLVEPATVAWTACMEAEIRDDRPLVIWGLGPLALMCVALGRYFHAKEIFCVTRKKDSQRGRKRTEIAYELGASRIFDADELRGKEGLWDEACSVIVSSPPSTVSDAARLAGYGSVIVPFGIALDNSAKTEIDIDDLILHKKRIIPVLTEPARFFPKCIRLIEKGTIPAEKLLTHQIRLTDTKQFRDVYTKDEAVIKGIIINE